MKKTGFTMIELLVTVVILAVLATGAVVSYRSSTSKARDAKRISDIEQIRSALDMYKADFGTYPLSASWGNIPVILSDDSYISVIPVDPQGYTYQYRSTADQYGYELNAHLENTTGLTQSCSTYSLTCGTIVCNYCVKNP